MLSDGTKFNAGWHRIQSADEEPLDVNVTPASALWKHDGIQPERVEAP